MKSNENATADALNGPQSRALSALLSGSTTGDAAVAADVSASTVWRWRHCNVAFKVALAQGQMDQRQRIQSAIVALAAQAVNVLGEIMNNPGATDTDRRAAAVALLDRLTPISEISTDVQVVGNEMAEVEIAEIRRSHALKLERMTAELSI